MKSIALFLLIIIHTCISAQTYKIRTLDQLINKKEPYWPTLKSLIKTASNHVEILPKDKRRADSALLKTQVTTRSPLGAIIYETGGILIDHGWIRILGSGSKTLDRSVMEWNKGKTYEKDFDGRP